MKNQLIINGSFSLYKKLKRFDISMSSYFTPQELLELSRLYNSVHQRKKRYFDKILHWFFAISFLPYFSDFKIVFGTLTFDDFHIKFKNKSKRDYISRFLKSNTIHYIANQDFGELNGREHYHFIALVDKKIDRELYRYGFCSFTFTTLTPKSLKKVKNYLLKLTNHSYKDSTSLTRVLFDRDTFLYDLIDLCFNNEYKLFKSDIIRTP